jgi:hypothetical protein
VTRSNINFDCQNYKITRVGGNPKGSGVIAAGVFARGNSDMGIMNCEFENFDAGIAITGSNITIDNVVSKNNRTGLSIHGGSGGNVIKNSVFSNNQSHGVDYQRYIGGEFDNIIANNNGEAGIRFTVGGDDPEINVSIKNSIVCYNRPGFGRDIWLTTIAEQSEHRFLSGANNTCDVATESFKDSDAPSGQPCVNVCPLFASGSGTKNNPYIIENCQHLQNINHNEETLRSHYLLASNIDCSDFDFTPIGVSPNFSGVFDGGGNVISNLEINLPKQQIVGLFGVNSGVVKNVKLVDFSFFGNQYVGGLVGRNNGVISKCLADGFISVGTPLNVGSASGVGILVGYNSGGKIYESIAKGNISAVDFQTVGGLVGSHYIGSGSAIIENSYADVSFNLENVKFSGGFVGYTGTDTEVKNSYSICNDEIFVDYTHNLDGFDSCYYDLNLANNKEYVFGHAPAIPKTTSEMKTVSTFSGWDLSIWNICEGNYPELNWYKSSCD